MLLAIVSNNILLESWPIGLLQKCSDFIRTFKNTILYNETYVKATRGKATFIYERMTV